MYEDELRQADLQRAELRQRLERLAEDQRLTYEAIKRAETTYHQLTGYIDALRKVAAKVSQEDADSNLKVDEDGPRITNPSRVEVTDAALALVRNANKPMGRQELYDLLTEQGLAIHGKNPLMVFSTMLWRERERIARLRGHGYWPADKPYPPANYFPNSDEPTLL